MSPWLVLMLCPVVALAGISVEMDAASDADQTFIRAVGNQIDLISNAERNSFHLNDGELKRYIGTFFGKRPDDAYLRSPTPWDLYEKYGWEQVRRTLVPREANVLGLHTEPTIIAKQHFQNNSTVEATFEVKISQSISDTVETSWSSSHEFTVGQEIEYKINILAISGGGKTSFEYKGQFGKEEKHSKEVTVGSEAGLTVTLKPGQRVVVRLTANRGTMRAQVKYEGSLRGYTACNYSTPYKGHHFWGLWLPAVMQSSGVSNALTTTQTLEAGYYTDSEVTVEDEVTQATIYQQSAVQY